MPLQAAMSAGCQQTSPWNRRSWAHVGDVVRHSLARCEALGEGVGEGHRRVRWPDRIAPRHRKSPRTGQMGTACRDATAPTQHARGVRQLGFLYWDDSRQDLEPRAMVVRRARCHFTDVADRMCLLFEMVAAGGPAATSARSTWAWTPRPGRPRRYCLARPGLSAAGSRSIGAGAVG